MSRLFLLKLLFIVIIGPSNIGVAFGTDLKVNIFNTGQGNGVILTHGEKLLVLDFGHKGDLGHQVNLDPWTEVNSLSLTKTKKNIINKVIGDGVLEAKMVTSHDDSDHNNLIGGPVSRLDDKERKKVAADPKRKLAESKELGPIGNQLFAKINENRGKNGLPNLLPNLQRLEGGFGTKQQAQNFLDGSLGMDVKVEAIRPLTYRKSDNNNDKNLIVRITYAGRKLMFLGDAPSSLYTEIENDTNEGTETNKAEADFVLASHHGSDAHDEFGLLHRIVSRSTKAPVVVISSDPRVVDKLPKNSSISGFLRWSKKRKGNRVVREHTIVSDEDGKINSKNIKEPIFITSLAKTGYYSLIIKPAVPAAGGVAVQQGVQQGDMEMYDGDPLGAINLLGP
jgi:beta-lactamase superfamily II metal-dependent hydrolase